MLSALSERESKNWHTPSNTLLMMSELPVSARLHATKTQNGNNTWDLIDRKRENRLDGRTDENKKLGKECRAQLRADHQHWADEKAEAGERALSYGQVKDAFANVRQLRSVSMAVFSPSCMQGAFLSATSNVNISADKNNLTNF